MDKLPKKPAGGVIANITMAVDTNGLLKCSVNVGGVSKSVELVNLFGAAEKREEKKVDRRILKWTALAKSLGGASEQEILNVLRKFESGEVEAEVVHAVIATAKQANISISKPTVYETQAEYGIELSE
jgi:hypothetical protein